MTKKANKGGSSSSRSRAGKTSSMRLKPAQKRERESGSGSGSSDSQRKTANKRGELPTSDKRPEAKVKLSYKFTIPVLLLIIAIVGVLSLLVQREMEEKLLNEIKKDGASGVSMLTQLGKAMLRKHARTMKEGTFKEADLWPIGMGLIDKSDFYAAMGLKEGDPIKMNDFTRGLRKACLLRPFISYQNANHEDGNSAGIKNEIVDAYVLDTSKGKAFQIATVFASGGKRGLLKGVMVDSQVRIGNKKINLENEAGISVSRTSLEQGGGSYKVMVFTAKLPKLRGMVMLALRADVIDQEVSSLNNRVMMIGGIAIAIAIVLCLAIANLVTKPLKILQKDMAIVAGGDLEHRTRPHSNDEIGILATEFNEMTKQLLIARDAEKDAERLENELDMAREIQMKLLPSGIPKVKGIDMFAVYKPAKEVGGDYYDFLGIGTKDHMGIMVADVSGKGIPGSMVMATTRTVLRFVAAGNTSAKDTLAKVNQVVAADIRRGMFVTAFYVVYNARDKTILCGSAGHNPMVLLRASGELELINPNGIALGFDKGPIFSRTIQEEALQLQSGDRVVLYTDGVVEAMNKDSEEYSDERFYNFVKKNRQMSSKDLVNSLLKDLDRWKGRAEQHDDITIVTWRIE